MRILDANGNRASEGLRVVEDYFRFAQNHPAAAQRCKQLRHDLATLIEQLSLSARLAARDVSQDVGRTIQTSQEYHRPTMASVAWANLKRVQQALRSLEEFGKTFSPAWAQSLEQLRYKSYQLEHYLAGTPEARVQLSASANLCVLVDHGQSIDDFQRRAAALIEVKVPMLQLREKRADDGVRIRFAQTLVRLAEKSHTQIVINDRPDIAAAVDAHGVHLGQEDVPLSAARKFMQASQLIGLSTHSREQAVAAQAAGSDYIGAGPTFPSPTKTFDAFPGLPFLRQIAQEIALPAFAIGGIQLDNLERVLETGVQRVAVASAVWNASDPGKAAARFLACLPQLSLPAPQDS